MTAKRKTDVGRVHSLAVNIALHSLRQKRTIYFQNCVLLQKTSRSCRDVGIIGSFAFCVAVEIQLTRFYFTLDQLSEYGFYYI